MPVGAPLTPDEVRRYARHLILPELGDEGQRRLKGGRVLLVGAGGLGSPAALYLAAAGVGTIGIVDDDVVDETNLQRQVLYGTATLGRPKHIAAADRLHDLNPHVRVEAFSERLSAANALELLEGFDVVVDGSDNFPTRYLVSDACVRLGTPDVYGSIFRFEGQASIFAAPGGPCYRCLFRDPPPPELVPSCAEAGVLGILPGIIGSLQALETLKLLAGIGSSLVGRLVLFDALGLTFREVRLQRDPACPACGAHPTVTELVDYDYDAFCGLEPVAPTRSGHEITPTELARELAANHAIQLVDVREPWEWNLGHIEGARHLPLSGIEGGLGHLDSVRPVVTYCHHGVRSLAARDVLVKAGFKDVRSLAGGIDAWSREVDGAVPLY